MGSHHRGKQLQDRLFPIPTERRLLEVVRWFTDHRDVFFAHTELYADLRIGGDDAWELIERGHQVFGTSFVGLSLPASFGLITSGRTLRSTGTPTTPRRRFTSGW